MKNNKIIKKLPDLKKRVRYFLNTGVFSRNEVSHLIGELSDLGEIAIFGGMLRDLSIKGNKSFSSDVDLVIETKNEEELSRRLAKYKPIRNSFGGYRIVLSKWKVDIWPLFKTWAFSEGLVHGAGFQDLIKTTFFDWDAIVYEIGSGKIHCVDNYIAKIESGIVDINLEHNPNPVGTAIRALRFAVNNNARLTYRLTTYIEENLQNIDINEVCKKESMSYDNPVLTCELVNKIHESLISYRNNLCHDHFELPSSQIKLL